MFKFLYVALILSAITFANSAMAAEKRCGWFENPTPANAWLIDKDSEWIIGIQGGQQANGATPDFSGKEWVETNGGYGYGCACLTMLTNHKEKTVSKILHSEAKPLSSCRNDLTLKDKEPEHDFPNPPAQPVQLP